MGYPQSGRDGVPPGSGQDRTGVLPQPSQDEVPLARSG